jgi:hypothetical protein
VPDEFLYKGSSFCFIPFKIQLVIKGGVEPVFIPYFFSHKANVGKQPRIISTGINKSCKGRCSSTLSTIHFPEIKPIAIENRIFANLKE